MHVPSSHLNSSAVHSLGGGRVGTAVHTKPTQHYWQFQRIHICNKEEQELSSCWDGRPFGHNRHGPKSGGCCAPFRGGAGSPSNTRSLASSPTTVSSGILIHQTVWPQYTNVTDRADRRMASSLGQTVTCNGCPKTAIRDAQLAPTPKPEVEIWRKSHKRTRSTRLPIRL